MQYLVHSALLHFPFPFPPPSSLPFTLLPNTTHLCEIYCDQSTGLCPTWHSLHIYVENLHNSNLFCSDGQRDGVVLGEAKKKILFTLAERQRRSCCCGIILPDRRRYFSFLFFSGLLFVQISPTVMAVKSIVV